MRKYSDKKTVGGRFKYTIEKIRKGLIVVHIGNDVWKIGKISYALAKNGIDKIRHQIIYGPDDKEYHVYGKDISFITTNLPDKEEDYTGFTKNGNDSIEANVKIYILTHILDKKENWCFDLSIKPESSKHLKVIYDNGTVQNIIFNGEFKTVEINSNVWSNGKKVNTVQHTKVITPIAYRKF